jgi:uncharacterized SAM-binding protein YcdF (DUF218 family)
MPRGEVVASQEPLAPTVAKRPRTGLRLIIAGVVVALAAAIIYVLSQAGEFLIVHEPERADVIVVLDGEWPQAVKLQKEGYAKLILLEAATNQVVYGRTEADLAAEFLAQMKNPDMQICPITGETTFEQVVDVKRCMDSLHATSALIVAPNFDTRRVIETFRKRLPQYHWSIAASSAPARDAAEYWKHRRWAKTVLGAWEQYLGWKLGDARRPDAVLR